MPLGLQLLHEVDLVLWANLAMDFVDAQGACNRIGRGGAVAGGHHDFQACIVQRCNGISGGRLDRVGDREQASQDTIDRQIHHAGTGSAQLLGRNGKNGGIDSDLVHQRGVADRQRGASHLAAHPDAGGRLEALRRLQCQATMAGFRDDRVGQRVLAALVEAGRQVQHLLLSETFGRECCMECRTSLGQGSGLVHDQGVDLAQVLDRFGIAEQHAFPGGTAGRHHDRHRRGQPQRAGAGDDQDRDRVEHRERPRRLRSKQPPHDKGGNGNRQDRQHEPESHLVSHALHRCA